MGQTLSSNASTMAPRFSIRELIEPSRLSVSEPTAFSAFFGGQKDSDTDQRPTGNVILRLSAVARARQSGSEGSVNCPRGFLSTFRPLLSFSFNGVFLDPSSPVVNVSFDRREEAGCDRLRDALALLPRSHRIDIDTKESRQHRLARPE